ncbi:MAG: hypothetical protein ACRDVP_05955 [Acidimicrobiales bacterium]
MGVLLYHQITRSQALLDEMRARGKTHRQATRQLANRWVGILHTCLERQELYEETVAWKVKVDVAA